MQDPIELFEKIHQTLWKRPEQFKPAVMWGHLKRNPLEGFRSMLQVAEQPQFQTMETGFLLGVTLAYCYEKDPLGLMPLINAMNIEKGLADGGKPLI